MKLTKRDELKMFQVHRNSDESESHSLVFKISRTPQNATELLASPSIETKSGLKHILENASPVSVSDDKNKSLSSGSEAAFCKESKDIKIPKQENMEDESANSVKVETLYFPVKQEVSQERRRSLRLLTLKSKLNSSQVPLEMSSTNKRKGKPRKNSVRTPKVKEENIEPISSPKKNPHVLPKQLRLKSMLLIPSSPKSSNSKGASSVSENILGIRTPKFANVDPSQILSTFSQHRSTFKTSVQPMSYFFTKNDRTAESVSLYASRENSAYLYYFRKAKRDLAYLCKKYHMLDLITLDNCYGLSNFSLKRTEIMLSDIISGKEITFSRIGNDLTQNAWVSINVESSVCVVNPYSVGAFISGSESHHQNFKKICSDSLCHKIIIQSMNILYNEETVT